ncbi:hypothetical protein H0H92_010046, partial [Tricholoma furcatifolium]
EPRQLAQKLLVPQRLYLLDAPPRLPVLLLDGPPLLSLLDGSLSRLLLDGPSPVLLLDGPPPLPLLDAPPLRTMYRQPVDANEIFLKIFKVLIAYLSIDLVIPHVWEVCAVGRKPIDPEGSDYHDEDDDEDDDEYLETHTDHSSSPVAILGHTAPNIPSTISLDAPPSTSAAASTPHSHHPDRCISILPTNNNPIDTPVIPPQEDDGGEMDMNLEECVPRYIWSPFEDDNEESCDDDVGEKLEDEETKEVESWSYEEDPTMSKAKREFVGKYRVLAAEFEAAEEEWRQELAEWQRKKAESRHIPYIIEVVGKRRRLAGL